MEANKSQLQQLIKYGETYNLEFKENYTKEIVKEMCAFANATGGKILVGVTDEGKIKGFDRSNNNQSKIQELARNIEPSLDIKLYMVDTVLIIEVPEGLQKPYSANGKFFLRIGPNSQQLNREEVKDFFKREQRIFFDELQNKKFVLANDLNTNAFQRFKQFAGIDDTLTNNELLSNLDLIEDGFMKNAGVFLFSKQVTRFIRTATITCVLYQGYDKYKILDRKDYEADLYTNFTEVMNYLKSKLNTEYIIKGGPREERLELPEDALREAILNAIAHRDYYSTANIQVGIYKDRVEIENPGGLVGKMTINELLGRSLPRNPLLFGLMQRMDLVEKIGSGLIRINKAIKDYNVQPLKLEADLHWFKLIFTRTKSIERTTTNASEVKITSEERILQMLKSEPYSTIKDLAMKTGLSEKTIEWNLDKLKQTNKIERVGSRKKGHWIVRE